MSRVFHLYASTLLASSLLAGTMALIGPSFPSKQASNNIRPPIGKPTPPQQDASPTATTSNTFPSSLAKTIVFEKFNEPDSGRRKAGRISASARRAKDYQKVVPVLKPTFSSSSSSSIQTQAIRNDDKDGSPFLLGNGVTLSKSDAGTLIMDFPPARSADKASLLGAGAFSVAWFSAIVPATIASGGGAGLFFMLPFWAAGGIMAKNVMVDPFVSNQLKIGTYAWSLTSTYGGPAKRSRKVLGEQEGATADVRGARVEERYVRDEERNETKVYHDLKLYVAKNKAVDIPTPPESTALELEYLAGQINQHLETIRRTTSGPDNKLLLGEQ